MEGLLGDVLQQIAEPVALLEGRTGQNSLNQLPSGIRLEVIN